MVLFSIMLHLHYMALLIMRIMLSLGGVQKLQEGEFIYQVILSNLTVLVDQLHAELPEVVSAEVVSDPGANSYDTDSHWLSTALPTACHEDVTMPASSSKSISRHYPERSDAYSFGVFLLELVSGQEARELYSSDSERTLAEWALVVVHGRNWNSSTCSLLH
ncbi:hypothetical protein Droror1_Dr00016401 [Drosera rotundifolia]